MSTDREKAASPPPADVPAAIQFDQAEFGQSAESPTGGPSLQCQSCGSSISDAYYASGEAIVCPDCHNRMTTTGAQGSRMSRLFRATLFGLAAALVGTLIWYGVRAVTGYEIGLIAIVVGLLVGGAVRAGSYGKGGLGYQLLAVLLTYCSIVANYVPDVYQGLREAARQSRAEQAQVSSSTTQGSADRSATATGDAAGTDEASSADDPSFEDLSTLGRITVVLVFVLILFAVAFIAPVLGGLENIIGLLIILFALWEAWKMNRAGLVSFTGPHRVASGPSLGGAA